MTPGPSFQFYPTDLAPQVDPLTMEERGVYLTLMRHLWPSGPMPLDEVEALIGKPWLSCSPILRRRFNEDAGVLSLEWMEKQRKKQVIFREIQSERGKRGGRPTSKNQRQSKAKKGSLSPGFDEPKPNKSLRGVNPRVGVGEGIGDRVGIGEGGGEGQPRARNTHTHEAVPEVWPTFEDWWKLYSHGSRKLSAEQWAKISQKDREAIMENTPLYIASRPDPKFRKHGERYLKNRTWEDPIINSTDTTNGKSASQLSEADKLSAALAIAESRRQAAAAHADPDGHADGGW